MTSKRLDIDGLLAGKVEIDDVESGGFIFVVKNKELPHPALYFKELFLNQKKFEHISNYEIAHSLGITVKYFINFLSEKKDITSALAKKLEALTGLPYEFWIRCQKRHDSSKT